MGRAIIFLLLCPALAWADTIYLHDGQTVTGEIIAETDEVVQVKERVGASGYAEARYPRARIARIERGPTERGEPLAQIAAAPPTAPSATTGPTAEQLAAARAINQINEVMRREEAKEDIRRLSSAVENYKAVSGEFPTTLKLGEMKTIAEVTQFMPLDKKKKVVRQRLELVKALTVDPWGQEYRYVCPGRHGAFDLFSVGQDGQEGTADDVTNW
jgi:type II secretion system protein G